MGIIVKMSDSVYLSSFTLSVYVAFLCLVEKMPAPSDSNFLLTSSSSAFKASLCVRPLAVALALELAVTTVPVAGSTPLDVNVHVAPSVDVGGGGGGDGE